ncbi:MULTISPECIES: hypothetical protein [Streptomyces]|uniref:hypothetical protein n=1 Tax=Streptomyces TaxID=1883 RepID=UPI00117CB614|nr:hypothetical protein [Streptomyces murinus]MYQ97887.1 hypothetical protein [Streptomyces sp. SID6139]MYR23764.1 hypothetical protein [Streptomyces sp. SID6137]
MKHNYIRMAAATAMAGVTFGIAAPAANAVEANRAAVAASVSAADFEALKTANPASATNGEAEMTAQEFAELTAEGEAQSGLVAVKGKAGAVIALLKKSPGLFKAAVKAAKKGARAFESWVNSLSNWNPVKWAIKSAPDAIIWEVIKYLANQ